LIEHPATGAPPPAAGQLFTTEEEFSPDV